MSIRWPVVSLREALRYRKEFVTIDDLAIYRRPRVRLHAQGIVLRDEIPGALINTKKQQICRLGEFLVAEIDAKVGGFGIVPSALDGAIVSSHYFLFDIDESKLDRRFLDHFIRTPSFSEQVAAQGSTNYAAIRPGHVLDYEIPLPPIAEQRAVVARIEELAAQVKEVRSVRDEAAVQLDQLLPKAASGSYDEAQGLAGRCERLADLCRRITDGSHITPTYIEDGIPFLSVKDITAGTIRFEEARRISREQHAFLTRTCKAERGDVLLTKVGTTGFAKAIDVDREFSIFVSLALLKLDRSLLLPEFVEYMLNSSRLRDYSRENTRGVGNKNLVLKFIRQLPMPAPTLSHQRRIVARLDGLKTEINRLKLLQTSTAAELDALVPSILDRAFKGAL